MGGTAVKVGGREGLFPDNRDGQRTGWCQRTVGEAKVLSAQESRKQANPDDRQEDRAILWALLWVQQTGFQEGGVNRGLFRLLLLQLPTGFSGFVFPAH